jgi:hypothetical protein
LVELETDAATSRPDENLNRDLAIGLSGVVEINDGVNAFHNLALHHRFPGESRVDVHDIRF